MEPSDYMKLLGAGAVTLGALTTATALYMTQRPKPMKLLVDMEKQSIEVPGTDRAHVSSMCKDGKLMEYLFDDAKTMHESLVRGARVSNNGPCVGWKPSASEPYNWISYNDVIRRAMNVGAGLVANGEKTGNKTYIGIYSQNRPEYFILEHGCYCYSMVLVPLYDTLGAEACTFIINQAEISTVIVDNNKKVASLLKLIKQTPNLHTIVIMDPIDKANDLEAQKLGVKVIAYEDLEKMGEDSPIEAIPPSRDDLCLVCYTSGTTGLPKGALLTHRGIVATVSACSVQIINPYTNWKISNDDCMISYLPLAHSYERLLEGYCYMHGARIGFFQGNVKTLMDDIKELRPTIFPTVPRLLSRVYDKVMNKVNQSIFKKFLFNLALREKQKELDSGVVRNDSMWDRLVFKSIQESLGGRMKFVSTGSAPMSPVILSFLRCCMGCPVVEGYGQTECHAIATLQHLSDPGTGQVGPPLACNYIKLADVPDMNYYAATDKGEICVKGPSVFKGYLKDPIKTKEALDNEGWLHTGDIGQWMPNGTLKVIDRQKNIFKLSQGEYIAPEKIENVYIRSAPIAQIYVHGNSLKSCVVGIAVPDPDVFPKWVKNKTGVTGTIKEMASNRDVINAVMADLHEIGKAGGLNSLEQIKDLYLYAEMFTLENGLLTPTMKAKRQELCRYFTSQIDDMYRDLS